MGEGKILKKGRVRYSSLGREKRGEKATPEKRGRAPGVGKKGGRDGEEMRMEWRNTKY